MAQELLVVALAAVLTWTFAAAKVDSSQKYLRHSLAIVGCPSARSNLVQRDAEVDSQWA